MRIAIGLLIAATLSACAGSSNTADLPRRTAPVAPVAAAPPPAPVPATLTTTSDGRVVVQLGALRYAVRPPVGWTATPFRSTDRAAGTGDVYVVATPPGQPTSSVADLFVSFEVFDKSDRAPGVERKLANIGEERRARRAEFAIDRLAPVRLDDGRQAQLFLLRNNPSDEWEAIAFVDEGVTVAEMMLLGRARADFDKAMPLFRDAVRSYRRL